jgi:hypothetical protein
MKGSEHHGAVEAGLTVEATDQPDIVGRMCMLEPQKMLRLPTLSQTIH